MNNYVYLWDNLLSITTIIITMALWKISVKFDTNKGGQKLVKGMFVEIPTTSTSDPLALSKYHQQIVDALNSKYAMHLDKFFVTGSYFVSERID